MKKSIEFTFQDVFGGDGEIRYKDMIVPKLQRKKTTSKTRSDLGIAVESSMDEVSTEKRKTEIHTFRHAGSTPLLRLGGTHGKLWGVLEEARKTLNMLGEGSFRNTGITKSIQIQPVWVELEPLEKIKLESLPQLLNTIGHKSMIVQYFDVIPKCKAQIDLIYPDKLDKLVNQLLEQIQSMGILNKRRATIIGLKEIKD